MTKHAKTRKPIDADLVGNPFIGGSKGTTMAGVTPDDLEAFEGVNTIEGDVENDPNRQGGIDKAVSRGGADRHGRVNTNASSRTDHSVSRRPVLQGKMTHEQQLRMLERKPDVPDRRQVEAALERAGRGDVARAHLPGARETDSRRSRESSGQVGHTPQRQGGSRSGKKQIGPGAQGKGVGAGADTDIPKDKIGENMVLSNRDKSKHSGQRGMDGKLVQTEQWQDHSANRLGDD